MNTEVSPVLPGASPTDPRRAAVAKVLASRQFRQAKRLCAFLKYVTDKALSGKTEGVSELPIGVEVFGRPPGYNPAEDNIVRSTARQVRDRLSLYYHEDGAYDEWRIILTPGSYVPRFEPAIPEPPSMPVTLPVSPPSATGKPGWMPILRWAGVLAGATIVLLALNANSNQQPRRNPLWSTLLDSPKRLILVSGDSGSVLRQNLTGSTLHIRDYAARNFPTTSLTPGIDPATLEDIGGRRYTSYSDVRFGVRLAMLPGGIPRERFDMRFARDFTVEEMKGANVILVGAPQGNPWVELFDKDLNFRIVSDEPNRTLKVLNRNPQVSEQPEYLYSAHDSNRRVYALISLTPNLDNTGHVLLVQGTTVAGVEAATDFLFNDAAMAEVLKSTPGGKLHKLEILLEAAFIAGSGGRAEVRALRSQ